MRLLYTLFTLAIGGYGLFWLADKNPDLKQKAEELLDFRTTNALEMRYGFDHVKEKTLLKKRGARLLDPELKFYPYLLMNVKYSVSNQTKEGIILWDLTDGEMVLDTKTWGKTHGFADCILSSAQAPELKILNCLAQGGGNVDFAMLQEKLDIETPVLEVLIRSCIKKNLIIASGMNCYRLHLQNPKLSSIPLTKLTQKLTSRPHKRAIRGQKHFSKAQVMRLAKAAFGENFSIRTTSEIYLPVHRVLVQAIDGSTHTCHYNALTGEELPPTGFYE